MLGLNFERPLLQCGCAGATNCQTPVEDQRLELQLWILRSRADFYCLFRIARGPQLLSFR